MAVVDSRHIEEAAVCTVQGMNWWKEQVVLLVTGRLALVMHRSLLV